ncbi:MAG: ribonuclease H-like domain-containing protein, partial [Thermodesulfobacteriota bacterium]|nr:ribonuclease H-like domain-containing protein [Thermodesulfobacteriota bacterium]
LDQKLHGTFSIVQRVDDIVARESKEPRLLFFDLETQKTAKDVGGWQNSHLMRISVAVVFDSIEKQFQAFDEAGTNDLLDLLNKADLIIGFNIRNFDYRVLGAYTNSVLNDLPTFDILEDIHKRLGYRLSLDHLAKETLNKGKTAHGLQAVEWFREGEIKKLTEYCRRDVLITRDLFMYGLEKGHLVYKEKSYNTRVRLFVDWNLDDMVRA